MNARSTRVWQEVYLDIPRPDRDLLVRERRYDLVILADDDISFVRDGLRESKRLHHSTTSYFAQQLSDDGISYTIVSGTLEERLEKVIFLCDQLLASGKNMFDRFPETSRS